MFSLDQLKQIKAMYETAGVQGIKQILIASEIYKILIDEIEKMESEGK